MSATVDLNSIPLAPSFVMEMYYSEKPIDFSQLPPYRAEIPVWKFETSDTNDTGAEAEVRVNYRLLNTYEVTILLANGLTAADAQLQVGLLESGTNTDFTQRRIADIPRGDNYYNSFDKVKPNHKINTGLAIRITEVNDGVTLRSRLEVQLVPVIP